MSATFGAFSAPSRCPSIVRAMSTERSVQSEPWLRPSNVTVPIITTTNDDGARHRRRAAAGRRAAAAAPITPSRALHGEIREKRLK